MNDDHEPLFTQITESSFLWKLSIKSYCKWLDMLITNNMHELLPKASSIYLEGTKIVVQKYENYKLVNINENKLKIHEFLTKQRNMKYIKLISDAEYMLEDQQGNILFSPWIIGDFDCESHELSEYNYDTYWSSLNTKKPILDVKKLDRDMACLPKPYSALFSEYTDIVKELRLSEKSKNLMDRYKPFKYIFQDGDNQIWISKKYVIKMVSSPEIYDHEISIMQLGIEYLPKMVDNWISEELEETEHFLVMENAGKTLQSLYYTDKLIPAEINQQIELLKANIAKHDLIALDPHLGNIVINDNGSLTMIDMEYLCWIVDHDAILSKTKNYTPKCSAKMYKLFQTILN